jgi:hypothetical protein
MLLDLMSAVPELGSLESGTVKGLTKLASAEKKIYKLSKDAEKGLKFFDTATGKYVKASEAIGLPETMLKKTEWTYEELMDAAKKINVNTPKDGASFWTGFYEGNKELATIWSDMNKKFTLEMTPGGAWLEKILYGTKNSFTKEQKELLFLGLSKRYAQEASGTVYAFTLGTTFDKTKAFWGAELPRLKKKMKQGSVYDIFWFDY